LRISAFGLILFFVSLNISLYLINETAILPSYSQSPYESPQNIQAKLVHLDLSAENLMIGIVAAAASGLIGLITGHLLFGGTVALIFLAMDILFPIVKWVVFGLPEFMRQMGVPEILYVSVTALMSLVWFWFLVGLIVQRPLEE
jgi:hypothetical protein